METPTESSFFLSGRLGALLDRWQPPSGLVLIGTALFVGIFTGIGAILFRYLISGVAWVGYQWIPEVTSGLGKAYVVIVPAVGGLLVGLHALEALRAVCGKDWLPVGRVIYVVNPDEEIGSPSSTATIAGERLMKATRSS